MQQLLFATLQSYHLSIRENRNEIKTNKWIASSRVDIWMYPRVAYLGITGRIYS